MIFNRGDVRSNKLSENNEELQNDRTAQKAQCSSCLLDTQLQLIVNTFLLCSLFFPPFFFFFFQRQLNVTLLCPFYIHVQKSSQCWRHTLEPRLLPIKLQIYKPSEMAAETPVWPAVHHSLVLCLVVSYALMTSD